MKNGHHRTSKGQRHRLFQIGMSTRPSLYPTGLFDMARKSNINVNIWDMVLTVFYSKYFITMGLRSMKWDEWIGKVVTRAKVLLRTYTHRRTELDNHYLRYHADKNRRIKERGTKSCKTAPEAMDGAIELLEEL